MRQIPIALGILTLLSTMGLAAEPLPVPELEMQAEPPPPFTYWAPAGSTIINHPNGDAVWIADQDGKPVAYYFGDQCRASEYQHFAGQPLSAFPEPSADDVWRFACTQCAVTSDLSYARMNISFDEETEIIQAISCG